MQVTGDVASALHCKSSKEPARAAHALTRGYELSGFDAVARYGIDGYCRMARWIAILVQAQFGLLGVSRQ